jgi:hypothetical protein
MAKNEKTSAKVASVASKGLKDPKSLTAKQVKSVSAAALTQTADKGKTAGKTKAAKAPAAKAPAAKAPAAKAAAKKK